MKLFLAKKLLVDKEPPTIKRSVFNRFNTMGQGWVCKECDNGAHFRCSSTYCNCSCKESLYNDL